MSIDSSGGLLEGIRLSDGNNIFTFPPRTFISDDSALQSIKGRAEYVIIVDSNNSSKHNLEISDPDLKFSWTKNYGSVVRFSYDNYNKRWLPSPGGKREDLGEITNSTRLISPIPDVTVSDSPFDIYIGSTTRVLTFKVVLVGTEGDFTPATSLASGNLELSKQDGKLNFSQVDVTSYLGNTVFVQRQEFFDRTKSTGNIGSLPISNTDYFLFLNPRPGTGQKPRLRIGYHALLTPIEVSNEFSLGTPDIGTFTWSRDTGRVRISPIDLVSFGGYDLYYDGVSNGELKFSITTVGKITSSFPVSAFTIADAIGVTDQKRFIIFATLLGQRHYFDVEIHNGIPISGNEPGVGTVYLDSSDGSVYFNSSDVSIFSSSSFQYLDSIIPIESGVSIQFYRSGGNGSGIPKVPDFTVSYEVKNQIVVDGITASPFVMLPTTPIVDSSLVFSILAAPGSNGIFTGNLLDSYDSSKQGLSYILDLDNHRLDFANRKTVQKTLLKSVPSIKLDDGAISRHGLEITINGSSSVIGSDFKFDSDSGLIEFFEPVGENDPLNRSNISGITISQSIFESNDDSFFPSDVKKFLFFKSGSNVGIYEINKYIDSRHVNVSPDFVASDTVVIDLKAGEEIVADRFWIPLRPKYKKIEISIADSKTSEFSILKNTSYIVMKNVGQINLLNPARPGQVINIKYIAMETLDDGATYNPVNKTENASFKVRQEIAKTSVGSTIATFNPDGRVVTLDNKITVYLNGVKLDNNDFQFQVPGTLTLSQPIGSGQSLIINYFVSEALGGETTFSLLSSIIDIDSAEIIEGENAVFNGDQTEIISSGSGIFISKKEVVIVRTVYYDTVKDETIVTFQQPPAISSDSSELLVCDPIDGSYSITETASIDVIINGTNFFLVNGNVSSLYKSGTIVEIDNYPFSVLASSYTPSSGRTRVTLTAPVKKNYIIAKITRTIRPILFNGTEFRTSMSASVDLPFLVIKMGNVREILIRDVDFTLTEGGAISLISEIGFRDSLHVLYVARSFQPVGTVLVANYAYAISPGASNGINGQRLTATYNLYAPDTFFYRIETVGTFLPEVKDLLRSSSSSGSSGPSTQDVKGQSNKDYGRISPYFNEQHLYNIDVVISRFLLFYNEIINGYEDILSNLDGRVIGGNQGRFRFDGKFNNPPRKNFSGITNDIDDSIVLYNTIELTGFFLFKEVAVYGKMSSKNDKSRLFPTHVVQSSAIGGNIESKDRGSSIGSLDRKDIIDVQSIQSSKARGFFTAVSGSNSFLLDKNGDEKYLVPQFIVGQDVSVYTLDGVFLYNSKVYSADVGSNATIVLVDPVSIPEGSLLQDVSDGGNSKNHFYTPGRDVVVSNGNGQIINNTYPSPLNALQNKVIGNEILDFQLSINNQDIKPIRIPTLDGLERNDDGKLPEPLLQRKNEVYLLDKEYFVSSTLGFAKLNSDLVTATSVTTSVAVSDKIKFLDGPNSGLERIVSEIGPSVFTISVPLLVSDFSGSNFEIVSRTTLIDILSDEIPIIESNLANGATSSGAELNIIDSELISVDKIVNLSGDQIVSGIGIAGVSILTDQDVDFTLSGVKSGDFIHVETGVNHGVYKISTVSTNSITLDNNNPFHNFPNTVETEYSVFRISSLLGSKHPEFYTQFIFDTINFFNSTVSFLSNPTYAGKISRSVVVSYRKTAVKTFIKQIEGLLRSGNLYEVRYLWIDQRTNMKSGIAVQRNIAITKRVEDLLKITEDQKKLIVSEAM